MKTTLRPTLVLLLAASLAAPAAAQRVKLGDGAYWLSTQGSDRDPPAAPNRTAALLATAAQTNQWYSSLIFSPTPEVIYAQPLSVRATPAGLELALPHKEVVPTARGDTEIHYPHRDPLVISAVAFAPGPSRLAKAGDWSIDIDQASGADHVVTTVAHGSPFVWLHVSRGDVRVRLPAAGERLAGSGAEDARMLALQVKGSAYALFAPTGARWEQQSPTEWIAHLPAGRDYLSAAVLPDTAPATLALFAQHAYAFVVDTHVAWHYDAPTSRVATSFEATTQVQEGDPQTPLLGLYPHQWLGNASVEGRLGPAFDTVRGPVKLLAASRFDTALRYTGFVPFWPGLKSDDRLTELLKSDQRSARRMLLENGKGAYWQGKGLQRIATLMDVAEQQGDLAARDELLKLLEGRVQDWFSGDSNKTYFRYSKPLGTLVSYPDEYFAVEQMNDHHFHYGYWIRAMAEIALRDPAWAAKDRWGGLVEMMVSDIATTKRGGADFPFVRNFDAYEGHSWASGVGLGDAGNNQESSSEAVNAWAGLILWGEVTGNKPLRDLGVWLYASETSAVQTYVFDQHHVVFPPEYRNIETSMLFGAKYAHNTWWTDEPRQIKGINLLPVTTASLYLGADPDFVRRSLAELPAQTAVYESRMHRADPPDIWQDIFAETLALVDPKEALAHWNRWGAVEAGDTRSHALHMMLSLQRMGTADLSVTADTALYSVFRNAGVRTYLAYNAGANTIDVTFSDGMHVAVPAHSLVRQTR
ncbi:MAG: glycosyl hydrolase [Burkholderiaceae bacterium]